MSVIGTIIRHGASKVENVRFFGGSLKGFGALGRIAVVGVMAYSGYSYGHTYGHGITALYAATAMIPGPIGKGIFAAVTILESGKDLGDWMYKRQQDRKRSSFAKNRIDDKFGTINMMRQRSIQNLSRDHSSKQRVLGNEAFYLHR